MITRILGSHIELLLDEFPAVALLGPRQVGKTTLAHHIASKRDSLYLDLETERDRERLVDPAWLLQQYEERLVILDEVHRVPELFQELRALIDDGRRRGIRSGRFLLLGSASLDLSQQSESLAGRVAYVELPGITVHEAAETVRARDLWLRGGFPDALLARSDDASMRWRRNFIRTYVERDALFFRPRASSDALIRSWRMLAHAQGSLLNAARLASSLGLSAKSTTAYIDLLEDLMLVRRLPPWHANTSKRLVKSPKTYVRDSGVLHALLDIENRDQLLAHPIAGPSWEGFAVEQALTCAPDGTTAHFYRTSGGAELDLVLDVPRRGRWAVEIKLGSRRAPSRGFHLAREDVAASRAIVVTSTNEPPSQIAPDVETMGLAAFTADLASATSTSS